MDRIQGRSWLWVQLFWGVHKYTAVLLPIEESSKATERRFLPIVSNIKPMSITMWLLSVYTLYILNPACINECIALGKFKHGFPVKYHGRKIFVVKILTNTFLVVLFPSLPSLDYEKQCVKNWKKLNVFINIALCSILVISRKYI